MNLFRSQLEEKERRWSGEYIRIRIKQFCEYFFEVVEDQISFMNELLQLEKFRERIRGYVNLLSQNMIPDKEPLRKEPKYVLAGIMVRGEVPRGEMKCIYAWGSERPRFLRVNFKAMS